MPLATSGLIERNTWGLDLFFSLHGEETDASRNWHVSKDTRYTFPHMLVNSIEHTHNPTGNGTPASELFSKQQAQSYKQRGLVTLVLSSVSRGETCPHQLSGASALSNLSARLLEAPISVVFLLLSHADISSNHSSHSMPSGRTWHDPFSFHPGDSGSSVPCVTSGFSHHRPH